MIKHLQKLFLFSLLTALLNLSGIGWVNAQTITGFTPR